MPHYPTAPAAPVERSWSVGTIVLALGALCLVVAGFIFITRSWDDLGLVARTLVLTGVTVVIGVLGVWVTRRPLRASAEAVWSVFVGLLTLDFFAARHENLLGLGVLSPGWACVAWGVALLGLGAGLTAWARQHVRTDLVATSVAAAAGIALAGAGAMAAPDDWDAFWRAFLALVVTGGLALAVRPLGLAGVTVAGRVVVVAFYAIAYVAALVELLTYPALDELVNDGHGLPMVLMTAASVVVGAVVPVLRIPAAILATIAVTALAVAPAAHEWWPGGSWLAVAAVSALAALAGSRGTGGWARGLRFGALVPLSGLGIVLLIWLGQTLAGIVELSDNSWTGDASMRPRFADRIDASPWVVAAVIALVPVTAWFVSRWPGPDSLRANGPGVTVFAAGTAVGLGLVPLDLPLWAACLVGLGVAAAALAARNVGVWREATIVGLVAVVSLLAQGSEVVSALTWLAGAVLLAALVVTSASTITRWVGTTGSVLLGLLAVVAGASALDVDGAITAVVVLALALAVLALADTVLHEHEARLPLALAGGLGTAAALLAGGSAGELSLRWSIAGAVLVALGLLVRDRRWLVWPGAGALLVAYVLLVVDSGFGFIEAYTLPLGAVALAAGLLAERRHPGGSTWVKLGPGLALALLPSVPQALAEPTGLRALVLGLGALVALAIGVRLRWQAPFVFGVTVVALLVLVNIGPYANEVPRTLLIALVGAVLLGLGITWEDRVRDSRQVAQFVRAMR